MDSDNLRLLIRFPNQDPSFTYGFEAGMVWEKMASGQPIEMPIRVENESLVRQMALKANYRYDIQRLVDGEWLYFEGSKRDDVP